MDDENTSKQPTAFDLIGGEPRLQALTERF